MTNGGAGEWLECMQIAAFPFGGPEFGPDDLTKCEEGVELLNPAP